jgi:cell division protein FtsL
MKNKSEMKKQKMNRKTIRRTGLSLLLLALFFMELFFYTWCRVQSIGTGYKISHESDQQKQLLMLQSRLKVETERLKSPERIAKIAREKLGLQLPNSEQVIVLQ